MKRIIFVFLMILFFYSDSRAQDRRIRDYGIRVGVMSPGSMNAITDVEGVQVGHVTLKIADSIRTGVTAVLPHGGNIFQQKVPGAVYVGNGFGKLAGITQVRELGTIETPVVLTNTLSVPAVVDALIGYTLSVEGNEDVRSVNPLVGETNDGRLNDIRGRHVKAHHVLKALEKADSGPVGEGAVGAGTGTICFGYKGGIGTASRVLPESSGGYTVGVLVQTNFGGVLKINGAPVGQELGNYYMQDRLNVTPDGSCMIVVTTDAPLNARNLERLAKRAMLGLAHTGGISSNGSGDYVIAFSANQRVRIAHKSNRRIRTIDVLRNDAMSPLFMATIEATEEAILNSLFVSSTTKGKEGYTVSELPEKKVLQILKRYGRIQSKSQQ